MFRSVVRDVLMCVFRWVLVRYFLIGSFVMCFARSLLRYVVRYVFMSFVLYLCIAFFRLLSSLFLSVCI